MIGTFTVQAVICLDVLTGANFIFLTWQKKKIHQIFINFLNEIKFFE